MAVNVSSAVQDVGIPLILCCSNIWKDLHISSSRQMLAGKKVMGSEERVRTNG